MPSLPAQPGAAPSLVIPIVEQQGWQLLQTHLSLSESFAIIVVTAPDALTLQDLEWHVPELIETGKTWDHFDLDPRRSPEAFLDQLFEPSRSRGHRQLLWVNTAALASARAEENHIFWDQAFTTLNRHRNQLHKTLDCTLAIVGTPDMLGVLRRVAPDFWSGRSSSIAFSAAPPPVVIELDNEASADVTNALDSPNSSFDLDAYARRVIDHCGAIPLSERGGTDTRDRISLSQIFVEPSLRAYPQLDPDWIELDAETAEAVRRGDASRLPDHRQERAQHLLSLYRDQPLRPALDVLADEKLRGLIILGDAGVGKSSLIRQMTLQWASAHLGHIHSKVRLPIPILIELRSYATSAARAPGLSLLDYQEQSDLALLRLSRQWCEYILSKGTAMLILDGLDEVADHRLRHSIAQQATALLAKDYRIILTSRRVGFNREDFAHSSRSPSATDPSRPTWSGYLLQEFDNPQRDLFTQKTHGLLYPNEAQRQEKGLSLKSRIARYPAIERLTRNPLLLTLAALLHRTGALGDNRVDLYSAASEMLLDTWELVRTVNDVPSPGQHLPPLLKDMKVRIVRRLARKIIESPDTQHLGENLFPVRLLEEAVREVIDPAGHSPDLAREYAELMPNLLRERHSLLCWAGEDLYSFIHRSFLEFFAAQAWAKDKDLAGLPPQEICDQFLIGPNAKAPRWRDERFQNIIPLYFGQLSDDRAAERLPLLWELKDGEAPDETALFAAGCFVEVKAREEHHEFAQRLQQRLILLAEAKWEEKDVWDQLSSEPNRDRCRRAARFLVQLWGNAPEIQRWLTATLHQTGGMTALRCEIVSQLGALYGPTKILRAQLTRALVTADNDHDLRTVVCQALDHEWGQNGLYEALASQPELRSLETLRIEQCFDLQSTQGLPPFPALKGLSLAGCTGLQGDGALMGLVGLDKLTALNLMGCTGLRSLSSLPQLPALRILYMEGCSGLQGADAFQGIDRQGKLQELYLNGCTGLTKEIVDRLRAQIGERCKIYWR